MAPRLAPRVAPALQAMSAGLSTRAPRQTWYGWYRLRGFMLGGLCLRGLRLRAFQDFGGSNLPRAWSRPDGPSNCSPPRFEQVRAASAIWHALANGRRGPERGSALALTGPKGVGTVALGIRHSGY